MPTNTPRRNLPQPIGSDPPSQLRVSATALAAAVDGDVEYQQATISALSATLAGRLLYATDSNQVLVDLGSSLTTLLRAGQPLLTQAFAVSSTTAAYGTHVSAVAGVTITLPAPAAGQMITITAGYPLSSPVTVAGSNIYGVGLVGASSFTLGSALASVTMLGDGTNWLIIAGQQDSGWIPLTYGTNWRVLSGSGVAAARLVGDRITLRGTLQNNTGGTVSGPSSPIATVPSGLRPVDPFNWAVYSAGNSLLSLSNSGGLLSIGLGSISNGDWVVLSGINYSVN